jgi:hypothetical protein
MGSGGRLMKILVTGGPVHGYLDSIKIITNRFRGGRMLALAHTLERNYDCEVTYLNSKHIELPDFGDVGPPLYDVWRHDGFDDYYRIVTETAHEFDAVVLGAAVANLLPAKPFEGKFPSHDYKVGDIIPIDFCIAPRVIDQIKNVAPKTKLFGFKLFDGPYEELIEAAYDIVLESRAVAVFANFPHSLDIKWAVTKEHGERSIYNLDSLAKFIYTCTKDVYYKTKLIPFNQDELLSYISNNPRHREALDRCMSVRSAYSDKFQKKFGKKEYVFGTIAGRVRKNALSGVLCGTKSGGHMVDGVSFITTERGKKDMNSWAYVDGVDHKNHIVDVFGKKATLNAPLLSFLFGIQPRCETIVHYHGTHPDLKPDLFDPWAPPGTVRDSRRHKMSSFGIEDHGVFLMLDGKGNII